MLFAGSINVKISNLREEKWVILTLAIGATLIAAVLISLAIRSGGYGLAEDLEVSGPIAIIVCLAARWISVFLSLNARALVGALKADRLGPANLLTWGGLRGGLRLPWPWHCRTARRRT